MPKKGPLLFCKNDENVSVKRALKPGQNKSVLGKYARALQPGTANCWADERQKPLKFNKKGIWNAHVISIYGGWLSKNVVRVLEWIQSYKSSGRVLCMSECMSEAIPACTTLLSVFIHMIIKIINFEKNFTVSLVSAWSVHKRMQNNHIRST